MPAYEPGGDCNQHADDKTNSERALVFVARMQDGQERPQDSRINVKRKKGAQSDEFRGRISKARNTLLDRVANIAFAKAEAAAQRG